MEVAGLIFGALPVAVAALQCYKIGKGASLAAHKRELHIQELIRTVKGYNAILQSSLEWLLRSIGCYTPGQPLRAEAFQHPATIKELETLLGPASTDAFHGTLQEVHSVLERLAKSIDGLVKNDDQSEQSEHSPLRNLIKQDLKHIRTRFRDGIKLALRKGEIDDCIAKLDFATNMMLRLQQTRHIIQVTETRSEQLSDVAAIRCIRKDATRLYMAIAKSSNSATCHQVHEARLYLEDFVLRSHSLSEASVGFRLMYEAQEYNSSRTIWHETFIEVYENNLETIPRVSRMSRLQPQLTSTQRVENLCLAIHDAREHQQLFLQVLNEDSLWTADHMRTWSIFREPIPIVTLQQILSSRRLSGSSILSPRKSVALAYKLADAVLKLSTTPWLRSIWPKTGLQFLQPQMGPLRRPGADTTEVDVTFPLSLHVFPGAHAAEHDTSPATDPQGVLIDFGVMLLELWHGIAFEQKFPVAGGEIGVDRWQKMGLAYSWLEEAELSLLPFQYDTVARCLRCYFDGCPVKPSWEDTAFIEGFLAGVLKPLSVVLNMKVEASIVDRGFDF